MLRLKESINRYIENCRLKEILHNPVIVENLLQKSILPIKVLSKQFESRDYSIEHMPSEYYWTTFFIYHYKIETQDNKIVQFDYIYSVDSYSNVEKVEIIEIIEKEGVSSVKSI